MIKFITEESLSNLKIYSKNENIPEAEFTSFLPNKYILQFGKNWQTYSYLESISEKAAYVAQLLELYVMIRNEEESFEKQEKEDSEIFYQHKRNLDLRIFRDSLYENDLNYKEKLATNRINTGRKIYNKLKELLVYSCIDSSLEKFISETKNNLRKLPDKSVIETKYYKEVLPEEDDIFHYYLLDCQQLIEPIIQEYFVADFYFTNKGKAVFVVQPEYYLYLVEDSRGKIAEIRKFYNFKDSYKNEYMNIIISELNNLSDEIKKNITPYIYQLRQNCNINNNDNTDLYNLMFEQLKNHPAYKKLQSILGKNDCDKTFSGFFYLRYLQFLDNKLELHKPLNQAVFYKILNSDIFIFAKYSDAIKNPFHQLFGKDIENFRQDNGIPAKWKPIVESLIKIVPYNKESYENENF